MRKAQTPLTVQKIMRLMILYWIKFSAWTPIHSLIPLNSVSPLFQIETTIKKIEFFNLLWKLLEGYKWSCPHLAPFTDSMHVWFCPDFNGTLNTITIWCGLISPPVTKAIAPTYVFIISLTQPNPIVWCQIQSLEITKLPCSAYL